LRRRAAILLAALLFPLAAVAQPAPAQVDVCFTPAQHCQPRIVAGDMQDVDAPLGQPSENEGVVTFRRAGQGQTSR